MPQTTIGCNHTTKQAFDNAKPQDLTSDEFLQRLLNEGVTTTRVVDVDEILSELDDVTGVDESVVRGAVEDALAANAGGH